MFVFAGARYVCRRWRAEQPAPLWVRGMGDPAPVPLYPQHPLTPFPRWGPAGPPSPDLGGGGLRPSSRHGLSFRRCAFPQQKVTIIIVPIDGDHGVGRYYRPDNIQPVPMVCIFLSTAKWRSSLPRSQEPASADRRRSGVQANPEARFRGGEAHAGRDPSQKQPTSRDRARPLRNTGERGDLPERACRSGFCFFFPKEKEEVFPRLTAILAPP